MSDGVHDYEKNMATCCGAGAGVKTPKPEETITDELTIKPDEFNPDDHYPPKGTPETALVVTLTCDQYHVVHHTGRYFHAQVECAGYHGEEVGIDDVPDEPGVWYFSGGKPWTSKDWETGVIDDGGISGDWRRATAEDFKDAGLECPMDLTHPTVKPVGRDLSEDMYVVFDGPPGAESGRFVELHDHKGRGVGERSGAGWTRDDGYWLLGPFRSVHSLTTGCNWGGMGSAPHDGETFLLDRGGSHTHAAPCFRHHTKGDEFDEGAEGNGWVVVEGCPDEGGYGCGTMYIPDSLVDDDWRWSPMPKRGA